MTKYHFYLRPELSPTYYNLGKFLRAQGWSSTRFNWRADFSEYNLQFHQAAAETFEFKHLLAQLVAEYCSHVMPVTYEINDQNWPVILSQLADRYYMQNHQLQDQVANLVWILKPALLNNGQHIKIFSRLSQLEQHFIAVNRLGGEHVLQQYIRQPHLLKDHKYSIRMFVVITDYAGAYLYPQGYFNVAQYPYQPEDFSDLAPHLTNEHLRADESNVIQIPTQRFDFFPALYKPIKTIAMQVIAGLQQKYAQAFVCQKRRTLAIFGFDFIVDTDKRVWLLEANHGPCFPVSDEHPLQHYLYDAFWRALIDEFVLPIAQRQPVEEIQYPIFDRIS